MEKDIFCKILSGEIKADYVAEGTDWIAIKDIRPATPVHILIFPRKHGALQNYSDSEKTILGNLLFAATEVATKLGVDKSGYRVVINYGDDSEAHVLDHLHLHLLAGKKLGSKIVRE